MDVQLQLWKASLAKGETVTLQVTGETLEPTLSKGDSVTLKKVPFADIKVGDVVFCLVRDKVGLRKIASQRDMYGKRSLEVNEDGQVHTVQESTVLGKVVTMHRKNAVPVEPSAFERIMRTLKRIIFPGT